MRLGPVEPVGEAGVRVVREPEQRRLITVEVGEPGTRGAAAGKDE